MEKKDHKSNKIHYILLGIVLIIGIIIRFWALGDKSLWIDEMYSYLFSSQKTFFGSFVYMFSDLSPPLYYLSLYSWLKLFGNSEFMIRFPSFLAGIASIIVIYFLTKKTFNKQIALGAAILTGLSPVMLYYSQEARPYSLFALFFTVAVSFWIEIINKINNNEEPDSKTLLKYSVFSLLTIFTHYWGLIPIFFQILYLLIFSLIKKRSIKPLFIATINIFYISGFYLFFQYSFLKKYVVVLNPAFARVNNLNPLIQIFNQIFYENYVFLLIIIIFLLLNIKKIIAFITNEITVKKLASPLIYLVYIIILPVCVYLILDKTSSFLHPRHLIFIVPVVYVLISYIIFSFDNQKELLKTGFLFGLSLVFLGIYLFVPQKIQNRAFIYYNKPKQEWKEATCYVVDNTDNNSVIIIDRIEDFYNYYFKKYDKNISKFNIIVDKQIFYKKGFNQKISEYRKKYRKVYIFSTSMLGVEQIQDSIKTIKPSCPGLKQKKFVNINLYECD